MRPALLITAGALMLYFVLGADIVSAQVDNLAEVGAQTGLGSEDPRIVVARIVRIALGFLGIIGVILVLYGGFLWMTSNGEPAKIEKAKAVLVNAGIGTVIILSALSITQFILGQLLAATGYGEGSSLDSGAEIIDSFSQALGNGNLDSHYPPRNAMDIARNTNLVVAFKVPIYAGSVMDGYAGDPTAVLPIRPSAVKIYETSLGDSSALTDVNVAITANLKSLVFDPQTFLGNSLTSTNYTVELTDEILLDENGSGGDVAIGSGYEWRFTVSTEIDVTPPKVTSVIPRKDSTNPRNILIQVNYSEPINPISASGFYPDPGPSPDFTTIKVFNSAVAIPSATSSTAALDPIVAGEWALVNQFASSEFVSSDACGENSCGETIYCLPGDSSLTARIQSATLGLEPPTAIIPPDGVVDMAGNSLDGSGDGVSTGPLTDSYTWDFDTTNEIVLVEPRIVSVNPSITPGLPAGDVGFDQPIAVVFDQMMSLSSINSDNVLLRSPSQQLWFTFASAMTEIADPVATANRIEVTETSIKHGIFTSNMLYGGEVTSGVRSIYQNCYIPSRSVSCQGNGDNCCNDIAQSGQCSYPNYTLPVM